MASDFHAGLVPGRRDTEPSPEPDESLSQHLHELIIREGPISFHDWMQSALYHPTLGYYSRSDRRRQGREGDYRTAPETSPLFAATFARYFARLFNELGSPTTLTIFEAGAGEGDFAHGVLSNLKVNHHHVFAATKYVIDEIGASRVNAQTAVAEFGEHCTFQSLAAITQPTEAAIVFSNELIDAFPVHRVTMLDEKLRELHVGWRDGQFVWIAGDLSDQVAEYCERVGLGLSENQIVEVNSGAEQFISRASSLMQRGFVITVDYGRNREELLSAPHLKQGSLRAFYRHRLVDDCLSRPGEQDLTTTIDWTQIKEAGDLVGLETLRQERLDQFLLKVGVLEELESATAGLTDADVMRWRTSIRELIMPHGLAAAFQVLVQKKVGKTLDTPSQP